MKTLTNRIKYHKLDSEKCIYTWESIWVIPTSLAPNLCILFLDNKLNLGFSIAILIMIIWLLISAIRIHNLSRALVDLKSKGNSMSEIRGVYQKKAHLTHIFFVLLPSIVFFSILIGNYLYQNYEFPSF